MQHVRRGRAIALIAAVLVAVGVLATGAWIAWRVLGGNDTVAAPGTLPPPPPPLPEPPGPGNTGVAEGTVLTPMGSATVTDPGTVIDGRDVSGAITVNAPDVVIRNTRITGDGSGFGVYVRGGSVTLIDVEISGVETGISGSYWMAVRADIHSVTGDGVKLGTSVTLQDSWIHDPSPSPDAHFDGAQLAVGATDVVVRHNTITVGPQASAALFIAPDLGPSSDGPVLVEDNEFGGGGWTLQCLDGAEGQYVVSNITIRDNRFLPDGTYGGANVTVPVTWRGNTWAGTGTPVRPGEPAP